MAPTVWPRQYRPVRLADATTAAERDVRTRSRFRAYGCEATLDLMFIVRVRARAKDGAREQFLHVLQQQIEEVPRRFPLCGTYRPCVDPTDAQEFLVYEEWPSREAYVDFSTSEYAGQVMSQLVPLMDKQDAAFFEAEPADPPLA